MANVPVIESTHGDDIHRLKLVSGKTKKYVCKTGFHANFPVLVWKNGVLQSPGSAEDYQISWGLIGTFELNSEPEGAKITIMYYPMEGVS